MVLPPQPFDVLRHDHRLFFIRVGRFQLKLLAVLVLREDVLRYLPLIATYQRISRLNDQLRRAIVLLQFKKSRVGVLALEVQDIVDVGTAEGVDALCIVTYDAYLLAFLRQLIHDGLLGKVRVLILIDEHEMELFNVFSADILVILE